MGTLGSYLQEAREALGLDLRDAAQQTRISINYLKAIEEEDFSKLPGEVFVKGFLKNYARFLQLPEDEVMRRYGEFGKQPRTAPSVPAPAAAAPMMDAPKTAPEPVREHRSGRNLEPYIWGAVAVSALTALILTMLPGRHPDRKADEHTVSQVTPTTALLTAPTATPKAEKLYLDIVALEDAWVLVRTDASPQKKAILKKGERLTWSAEERFLLSYAAVGNIELVLNGNMLTVKGPKNAVVRDLVINAQGIAYQKVESEQPPAPRKPKPATAATPTVQPQTKPALQQHPQLQSQPQPEAQPPEPQAAAPQPPREQPAPITSPIFSQ